MNRRQRRRENIKAGPGGRPDTLAESKAREETILVRTDKDVPLARDQTVDLVALGQEMGGQASFKTRKADPTRPFKTPPMDERLADFRKVMGTETSLSGLAYSTESTLLPDDHTLDGPAFDATRKIAEVMKPLRPDQRGRVLAGLHERGYPIPKESFTPATIVIAPDADRRIAAAHDVAAIINGGVKLQKLGESGLHKQVECFQAGQLIVIGDDRTMPVDMQRDMAGSWLEISQVFVVQHDWAAAFQNAKDFHEGPYNLPADLCTFEFRITGRRVNVTLLCGKAMGTSVRSLAKGMMCIETSQGWSMAPLFMLVDGRFVLNSEKAWAKDCWKPLAPLVDLVQAQIRAVCTALEMQVAETEIHRAPHKLNSQRERKGKPPLFDYHVVNLSHRKRYAPRAPEPGDLEVERARRRLHFVRGHARHYENHKVWIAPHFRGDPDLGFVDKEYRL